MAYGPWALPPSNGRHYMCKSYAKCRLRAIIKNQGQGHSKGQGRLVGQGHQVLRSLKGQWLKGHRLCHQVLATTTCASDTLNVDICKSYAECTQCHS